MTPRTRCATTWARCVRELPNRLRTDPRLMARVEAAKQELLASAFVQQFLDDAVARAYRALGADLTLGSGRRRLTG